MVTIIPDFPGADPQTRKPEHSGYEICIAYVSLFYFTLKIPWFVSSIGREGLASIVIKSEEQTKKQHGQWKRLGKTKIYCIPNMKKTDQPRIIISQ